MGKIHKTLILEGSRDTLLNDCLLLLKQHGINVSVGQFKTKLLNKLTNEGGISNLSLRSNYYLAGAARYYFDGSLTNNNDLSLLKKETWETNSIVLDDWNRDVCEKLNKIILFLRTEYIDSVGETWLQPENFGKMPIKTLFSTYKKVLNKMKNTGEKEKLDFSPNVGDNYTFEIIYDFNTCTKYCQPTSPGPWCISKYENWFQNYQRDKNVHYVIFRKDGWEAVPRPKNPLSEPGFTIEKPQDAYGNSLIAMLQSNKSPEPVYITSRWNHGHEVSCEADHAYTKDEFELITGVTDDDLKRIYEIWKSCKKEGLSAKEIKQQHIEALRTLKYIQIRINSGENIEQLLKKVETLFGGDKLKKNISICETDELPNMKFLVDRGKIIFETVTNKNILKIGNLVTVELPQNKANRIYCAKTHSFVNVAGVEIFKYIPRIETSDTGNVYVNGRYVSCDDDTINSYFNDIEWLEVKQSQTEACLINTKDGKPLTLPNGLKWFIRSNGGRNWEAKNRIYSHLYNNSIIEIHSTDGKKYFYLSYKNKFIDIPNYVNDYGREISPELGSFDSSCPNGVFAVTYEWGKNIVYYDEDALRYKDITFFNFATPCGNNGILILTIPKSESGKFSNLGFYHRYYMLFDIETKSFINIGDGSDYPLFCEDIDNFNGYIKIIRVNGNDKNSYCFFDYNKKCFINSPFSEDGPLFNLHAFWEDGIRVSRCYKMSDVNQTGDFITFAEYYNYSDKSNVKTIYDISTGYTQPMLLPNGGGEDTINEIFKIGYDDIRTMVNEAIARIIHIK